MTKFKGFYGTTSDGILVRVINEGMCGETPAYKVQYCRLGQAFAGGGMNVGQEIVPTGKVGWVRKSGVTRNRKGQNGVIWS